MERIQLSKGYGNIFSNSRFGGGPSAAMVGERATRAEDQLGFPHRVLPATDRRRTLEADRAQ